MQSILARARLPWSAEEQTVTVRVANLEPAKAIVGIFKRHAEGGVIVGSSMFRKTIGKFGGKSIRVWGVDKGVPPYVGMTLGVRQRRYVFLRLDKDLRPVTADDGEKRVSLRLLESRLKAELVAVKRNGLIDVADNEER